MWERSLSRNGPWEPVTDSRVPAYAVRRYNRTVKRGSWGDQLVIPVNRYYYRFLFCV
jgi:hypothetical protein